MSDNEKPDVTDERRFSDDIENSRKRAWVEVKKASANTRRLYLTILLIILFVAITLLLKIAPYTDSFKEDVISSWQFRAIFGLGFIVVLYRVWVLDSVSDISFVELDERLRFERSRYTHSAVTEESERDLALIYKDKSVPRPEMEKKTERSRKVVSGFNFVDHMRSIIESLDYQIDYAEEKASRLLEAGRAFVKWGIWLYVFNIIIWQAYLYYIDFSINAGIIVGMVSSTVIFLIMEFLGAWYLKQYRHYGDSAFSYMKVRSSYNRYMLAYCAILEFTTDDFSKAKEDMLRVLAESEKWPELKEINSNDFNYMLQSVESVGAVFEKLKGLFGRGNGTGGAA